MDSGGMGGEECALRTRYPRSLIKLIGTEEPVILLPQPPGSLMLQLLTETDSMSGVGGKTKDASFVEVAVNALGEGDAFDLVDRLEHRPDQPLHRLATMATGHRRPISS
jgi:hypothetical protein